MNINHQNHGEFLKTPKSSPKIALPQWLLNEKIERAIKSGHKLEELFLVIPVSDEVGEGEVLMETDYGNLRVFFCKEYFEFLKYGNTRPQALLLSAKRFNYPKISSISTRAFKQLGDIKSHI